MKIVRNYLTKNDCYTAGKTITVKGLMLHSVGCPQPKASVFISQWNRSGKGVCVHGFIQADDVVYQTLPWNYRGWHCASGSKGSGNNTHIGVEMTEPDTIKYSSGASFTDNNPAATEAHVRATYATAVELFASLCEENNLDPLADGVIISHREGYARGIASNHGDPEHLWNRFGLTMDGFRAAVKAAMSGDTIEEENMDQATFNEMFKTAMAQYRAEEGMKPSDTWAEEGVARAMEKGITDGTRPRDFATRQEVMIMTARAKE